ncbi:hypothetical protein LIER_23375 [Lithospermum erythrorhizon]|uniref:Uncharacterized protein n=1 Tax=Lithospermum erythrorhizon TaxID=34254 RepID=A0AAV3R0W4_LITER
MAMITRQFQAVVKVVRSDNGTEFKPLLPYFSEHEEIFVSGDVKFHESEFPFVQAHPTTSSTPRLSSSVGLDRVEPVGALVYDSDDEWGPVPDEPIPLILLLPRTSHLRWLPRPM